MNEEALQTGISVARGRTALQHGAAQFGVSDLMAPPEELPTQPDRVYGSNEQLWEALIDEGLRARMIIRLPGFWVSEWLPLRPGLFHTDRGRVRRAEAVSRLIAGPGVPAEARADFERWFGRRLSPELVTRLRPESTYVFDPRGKSMMFDGGVGCVRLKGKEIPSGRVWFMGASSTPRAHEGVPVALPDHLYDQVIERLSTEGAVRCDLTGRLTPIPEDFDPLYRDLVNLPQLYLLVERLKFSSAPNGSPFVANGAVLVEAPSVGVTPEADSDFADGLYHAFVSFVPAERHGIRDAAAWLSDVYVGELLKGRIVFDFDEQVRRFPGAVFSLEQVMSGQVSTTDAERLLGRCGASPVVQQKFAIRIKTLNAMMGDINVYGNHAVVAGPGGVAAGQGGAAAAGKSAAATEGAAAATQGAAAATNESAAATGQASARVRLVQRAKTSTQARVFGSTAVVATVAATILLVTGITDIGIAGYIVAVISVIVAVFPLYR